MLQLVPSSPRQIVGTEPIVLWRKPGRTPEGLMILTSVCMVPQCACRDLILQLSRLSPEARSIADHNGRTVVNTRPGARGLAHRPVLDVQMDIDTGHPLSNARTGVRPP